MHTLDFTLLDLSRIFSKVHLQVYSSVIHVLFLFKLSDCTSFQKHILAIPPIPVQTVSKYKSTHLKAYRKKTGRVETLVSVRDAPYLLLRLADKNGKLRFKLTECMFSVTNEHLKGHFKIVVDCML